VGVGQFSVTAFIGHCIHSLAITGDFDRLFWAPARRTLQFNRSEHMRARQCPIVWAERALSAPPTRRGDGRVAPNRRSSFGRTALHGNQGRKIWFFERLCMVRLLITGLSLVIKSSLGHSGDQTPDLSSFSDADLKTVTIQLEPTGCYGTCPGYSVTIHGDGRVEYNGKSHVKEIGTQEGRIETDKIRALASVFAKMKFTSNRTGSDGRTRDESRYRRLTHYQIVSRLDT